MITFEDYLADKHADQYQGLDDEMPDDCENWMADLSVDELIEYGEKYAKWVQGKQIERDAEIAYGYCNDDSDAAFQAQKAIRNQKTTK